MSNLAAMYRALERHADALAMFEKALEFFRRVLPANHPDIGEGCVRSDALHAV
jgi:tetratricopeptide (TPR) repeat protein